MAKKKAVKKKEKKIEVTLLDNTNVIGFVANIPWFTNKAQSVKLSIEYLERALNVVKALKLDSVRVTIEKDKPICFGDLDKGLVIAPRIENK